MNKQQSHTYIYPKTEDGPGHIKINHLDTCLCGIEEQHIADPEVGTKKLKLWIPGREICPACEQEFRVYLSRKSPLLADWS